MAKYLLLLFGLCCWLGAQPLSAQTFDWANQVGTVPTNSTGGLDAEAIAVDSGGGSYFTGAFDADTFTFANDTATTNFGFFSRLNNMVIGKYSTNGNPVWGYAPSPLNGGVSGQDIAYYKGHLYVSGEFGDTVAFSSTDTLVANTDGSAFIMKLDTSGNLQWVTKKDSVGSTSIAVHGSAVAIGGEKENFGNPDTFNHFFAKYDTTGTLQKTIISEYKPSKTLYQEVGDVGIDQNGNIIGGGDFKDSLTFGNIQIKGFKGVNNNNDGFLVKFDQNLNPLWMERIGDGSFKNMEEVRGIYVRDSGQFYATGVYEDSLLYRKKGFSGGGAGASGFIGEFQSNGSLNWLSKVTTNSSADAKGNGVIATADSVFAVGEVDGSTANFGKKTRSVSGAYGDVYVAKLDEKGNYKFVATTGATSNSSKKSGAFRPDRDIGLDSSRAAYISGGFANKISFGNQGVSGGGSFVTKLTNQGIILDTLSDSTFCPGDSVQAPFTVVGQFDSSNTFTAQLSDSAGQFKSPTLLDSLKGQTGDTIHTVIPEKVPAGTRYRIRIVSDNPANTSNLNPATLEIQNKPNLSLTAPAVTCGTDSVKPIVTTNASTFNWSPGNAVTDSAIQTPTLLLNNSNNFSLTVTNSVGCTTTKPLGVLPKVDTSSGNDSFYLKAYGNGSDDKGKAVVQACDGGYVIGGQINDSIGMMKISPSGKTKWSKKFKESISFYDDIAEVIRTQDGGYVAIGEHSRTIVYLVKTDSKGNIEWEKNWNGSYYPDFQDVTQAANGDILVLGESESFSNNAFQEVDIWLNRFSNKGKLKWSKYFETASDDGASEILRVAKDSFLVTGSVVKNSNRSYFLMKIDGQGNKQWLKELSNLGELAKTADDAIVMAGTKTSDILVTKIDYQGNTLWKRQIGGSKGFLTFSDVGNDVEGLDDSTILVAGETEVYGNGQFDGFMVLLDSKGKSLWSSTFGGSSSEELFGIEVTAKGNFVGVGNTFSSNLGKSDLFVVKTDTSQTTKCQNDPNPPNNKDASRTSGNLNNLNNLVSNNPGFTSNASSQSGTIREFLFCPVNADFAYKDTCLGATTKFFDSTFQDSLSSYSWSWNFGDPSTGSSNTSNQQNPTHVFSKADTFDVKLVASTGTYSDSITKSLIIKQSSLAVKAQPQDTTICPDDSVQLSVSDTSLRSYQWRPGDRVSDSTITEPYTYPGPDTLVLTVRDSSGCINRDSITINKKPNNPQPPDLTKLNTQSASRIQVKWDTPAATKNFKQYLLYRKPANQNTFGVTDTISTFDSTSLTDLGISTADSQTYDYVIKTQNACGTFSDPSDTLRSIALQKQILSDKKLRVKWNPSLFDDSFKYEVAYDRGSGFQLDTTLYQDTSYKRISCNNEGTYEITAIDTGSSDTVIANQISPAIKDTTPPTANLLSASRFGQGKEATYRLTLDQSDSGDFKESVVYQSVNQGSYQPLDTLANANGVINNYGRPAYPDSNKVCFRIQPIDTCGNKGPRSSPYCLIDLEGKPGNKLNRLSWTPYKAFKADTVQVQVLKNGSWNSLTNLDGTDTAYVHKGLNCLDTFQYRIKYQETGSNGLISYSDSVQLSPFDTTRPGTPKIAYASFGFNFNGLFKVKWNVTPNTDLYIVAGDTLFNQHDTTYSLTYPSPIGKAKCFTIEAQNVTCDTVYSATSMRHCPPYLKAERIRCRSAVKLNWKPYQGYDSFDGYDIGIKADSITGIKVLDTVGQGSTSFIHKTADTGVIYNYQLRVRDGTPLPLEPLSNTVELNNKPDLPLPPKVFGASKIVTNDTAGKVKVKWKPVPDKQNLDYYNLYYKPRAANSFQLLRSNLSLTRNSFVHQGLNTRNRNHQYYLTTVDSCGRESDSTGIHTTTNLSLTLKELEHKLKWTPYAGFNVQRIKIQRAFGSGGFNTIASQSIFTSLGTTFIDSNVRCGEQYSYRIKAIGPKGQYIYSDTVTETAFDNTPPDRPNLHRISVTNTDTSSGKIELLYTGPPQDNRKGYKLFRQSGNDSFKAIDSIQLGRRKKLRYADKPLNTYKRPYSYFIKAFDRCGNVSFPSDTHRSINLKANPKNGYIQLNWTPYFGWGLRTYKLQRKESLQGWKTIQNLQTGQLSYRDSQVICNNIYQYRIVGNESNTPYQSFSNTDTALSFKNDPPAPPAIQRVTVTATGKLDGVNKLSWNPSTNADVFNYIIYQKPEEGSSFSALDTVEKTTYRDSQVNTQNQYYEYRLKSIDRCLVPSDSFSTTHRSIHLEAKNGNEAIPINWNAYQGRPVKKYEVLRGGEVIATVSGRTTQYEDPKVTCDTFYHYQVRAILRGTDLQSRSNTDSAQSFQKQDPPPPYLQRASVVSFNNAVEVKWQPNKSTTINSYEVFRSTDGRLARVAQIQDQSRTSITDTFDIPNEQVCYYVRAFDACNNQSQLSNRGCVMDPQVEALKLKNKVSWPPYRKWQDGVQSYEVFKQLPGGSYTSLAQRDSNARFYTDKQLRDSANQFCYYIRAQGFGSETYSRSKRVCEKQPPVVHIPNTFSPGVTAGLNDQFGPEGLYIAKYEMEIYNRWGAQIFRTSDSESWNGTYKGKLVPQGVYHYQILVTGENGDRKTFDGTITVIR